MCMEACSSTDCSVSVVRARDHIYFRPSNVLLLQLCNYDLYMSLVAPEPRLDAYLTLVQGLGFSYIEV